MLGRLTGTHHGDLVQNHRIKVDRNIFLGGYHKKDIDPMITLLNDVDIYQNTLNIPHPYTADDAQWWIDHIRDEAVRIGFQPNWTIRQKRTGIIGGIGLVISDDALASTQEIGYWMGAPYRGQGIMTASIRAWSQYCFDRFDQLDALSAHIFTFNRPSQAVIQKAGFRENRLVTGYYQKNDRKLDAIEYLLPRHP